MVFSSLCAEPGSSYCGLLPQDAIVGMVDNSLKNNASIYRKILYLV